MSIDFSIVPMARPDGFFIVDRGTATERAVDPRNRQDSDALELMAWFREGNSAESWQPTAAERRNVSLSRRDFCVALVQANILNAQDAVAAARGEWPAPMDAFLSFLDAAQAVDVQIEWAAAATVERMHPFVLALGSWLSLSDAQMDALFGIAID